MKARYQAAVLALLLASPALANPRDDSGCLIGRLSVDDRSVIVAELQAERSETIAQRLRPPMDSCAAEQGWTADRSRTATGYAMGVLMRDAFRAQLVAQGIDTAALDRWFARQSTEFRTTAFVMPRDEHDAIVETLVGNELTAEQMGLNAAAVGRYLSALMIIERVERGLDL